MLVWFILDGDDLVIISVSSTAKVKYIRATPKGAVTIGGDSGDGAGYLIKGEFSIEANSDDYWVADQYGLHQAVQFNVETARTGIAAAGIGSDLIGGQAARAVGAGADVLQFLSAARLVGRSAASGHPGDDGGVDRPDVGAGGDIVDTEAKPRAACSETG